MTALLTTAAIAAGAIAARAASGGRPLECGVCLLLALAALVAVGLAAAAP